MLHLYSFRAMEVSMLEFVLSRACMCACRGAYEIGNGGSNAMT